MDRRRRFCAGLSLCLVLVIGCGGGGGGGGSDADDVADAPTDVTATDTPKDTDVPKDVPKTDVATDLGQDAKPADVVDVLDVLADVPPDGVSQDTILPDTPSDGIDDLPPGDTMSETIDDVPEDVEIVSTNAALASLALSHGTLSPAFAAGTTAYTSWVHEVTTSVTVTPTLAEAGASMTVEGDTVASGAASDPITLEKGPNTITIVVTAADGVTTRTYTIAMNRKHWVHPASLSAHFSPDNCPDGYEVMDINVVMADSGDALITWTHPVDISEDEPRRTIYKREYRGGAWNAAVAVPPTEAFHAVDAEYSYCAMDHAGNAIIAWVQPRAHLAPQQMYISEYRESAWTHPTDLTEDYVNFEATTRLGADAPVVAMDEDNNAIIAWIQKDDAEDNQVFKSEYRGGTWTHPTGLTNNISPNGQNAQEVRVAMDDEGRAVIVWKQFSGSYWYVYKAEYRSNAWSVPTSLSSRISPANQNCDSPRVAMDNQGNAIIVWVQSDGSHTQIFRAEYRNFAWTLPSSLSANISPDGQPADYPEVAMDDNGNAIIAWAQLDGSKYRIFKSEYRNGAWSDPADLTKGISPPQTHASSPVVAMDNDGSAVIVWMQNNDAALPQVFKSEYRNGSWTHPADILDNISPKIPNGTLAVDPKVAMDHRGNAIISWRQVSGGTANLVSVFVSEYR